MWERRTSLEGDRTGGRTWFPLLGHYKNSRLGRTRERDAGSGALRVLRRRESKGAWEREGRRCVEVIGDAL